MTQLNTPLNIGWMHVAAGVQQDPQTWAKLPILLLLAVVFLVFSPSLGSSFHLDDVTLFSDPAVTSPSGWWYVWRPLQTRPLTYFTFWLNFQIGGQNAAGYHAVNIFLHVLATWLLYRVLIRVAGARTAIIAAVLFGLHPIQVEPVAYIFERATVLATVFCLLSAHCWLDGNDQRSIGFFALALLSKEECVTFPLFLLLFRPAILPAFGMLCLSFAAGVRVLFAVELLHITGAGSRAGISPLDYFSTQGTVILRYFQLLLMPYGFTCDPDTPIVRDWRAWLAWTLIIGIAALAWKFLAHGKWFAAGLILLAPSSSIFPAGDLAADRRLYLPMVAFAGLAGLLLQRVNRQRIMIAVALGLAVLSAARIQIWRSEQRLWAEAAERSPEKVRPRILLARFSDLDTAMRILDAAQASAPGDPGPRIEKGLRWLAVKRPDLAAGEFEQALALAPDDATALNNHAVALSTLGEREAAIAELRHALRVDPCSTEARGNLAALGVTDAARCE